MCIACEMSFWSMIDALPPEARERILREQEARFACEAPQQAAQETAQEAATSSAEPRKDERAP